MHVQILSLYKNKPISMHCMYVQCTSIRKKVVLWIKDLKPTSNRDVINSIYSQTSLIRTPVIQAPPSTGQLILSILQEFALHNPCNTEKAELTSIFGSGYPVLKLTSLYES